jgi:hypothetical protein
MFEYYATGVYVGSNKIQVNGQLTLDALLPEKEIPVFSDSRLGGSRVGGPATTRKQTEMS